MAPYSDFRPFVRLFVRLLVRPKNEAARPANFFACAPAACPRRPHRATPGCAVTPRMAAPLNAEQRGGMPLEAEATYQRRRELGDW